MIHCHIEFHGRFRLFYCVPCHKRLRKTFSALYCQEALCQKLETKEPTPDEFVKCEGCEEIMNFEGEIK